MIGSVFDWCILADEQVSPLSGNTFLGKAFRFGLSGAFMITWAFTLNILLNEATTLHPAVAYIFVVLSQLGIGFILNRLYVFRNNNAGNAPAKKQLLQYLTLNTGLKALDWSVYSALVAIPGLHYLVAQSISTGLISVTKFFLFDRIFSDKPVIRNPEA